MQRNRGQHREGERNRHCDVGEDVPPDRRVGWGRQVSSALYVQAGLPPGGQVRCLRHLVPQLLLGSVQQGAGKASLALLVLFCVLLTLRFSWLQPVVQRPESGPQLHRAGDPRDARRAGQPSERRGEWAKALWKTKTCTAAQRFAVNEEYLRNYMHNINTTYSHNKNKTTP